MLLACIHLGIPASIALVLKKRQSQSSSISFKMKRLAAWSQAASPVITARCAARAVFSRGLFSRISQRVSVDLRHLFRCLISLEGRLFLKSKQLGSDYRWEARTRCVVVLHARVVVVACYGHTVLGPGNLILQSEKVLIRLQLRLRFVKDQ